MFRDSRFPLLCAGIFLSTLLAYFPAIDAGFIWNDSDYVTAPALRSLDGLARIWFELGATEQYYPILHSAFWLEHRLWGDSPTGYHLLNILLHAGAACLLAAVLRRCAIPGAALAAFVFALHPVGVESVAWISEQKNTLSLVFYLLAALVYLRFHASRRGITHLAATALFALGLLSKSTTATLPPALLVLFWWQRGRLDWKRDVLPLLPWFALGAAMGLFSAYVESHYVGAAGGEFALTGLQRTLLAGRIAWFYAAKLIWPADLIFIYPRWDIDPGQFSHWLFSIGVLVLLAALWRVRRWSRAPLAAALFFGGSLFPVLGFFNLYAFLYSYVADHWQYLPSIGLVVLGAAGLTRALATPIIGRHLRVIAPIALVAALAVLTLHQSRMYADMRTFYRTTVTRNPAAWMAHNNLGNLLREEGDLELAISHFEAALRVRSDLIKAHNNLALCLAELRRPHEALTHLERALEIAPDYLEAHNNLGRLLRELGRSGDALPHLLQAMQLAPDDADVRNNLGMVLRDLGRLPEALAQFEHAIRAAPESAPARLNLALTLSLLGRDDEAMHHYGEARRLNPAIPALPEN